MSSADRRGLPVISGIAVRLALYLPAFLWISRVWEESYGKIWLPWYKAVLRFSLPYDRLADLTVVWHKNEFLVAGNFSTTGFQLFHGRLLPPGLSISASTLLGHALIHPLILFTAVMAWPGLDWRRRLFRLILSIPFLWLLETVDVPLALAGVVDDVKAGGNLDSMMASWGFMLDGGGRMALSLASAIACAAFHDWLELHLPKPKIDQV